MPVQPKRFRPPGWKERKPWAKPERFQKDNRLRGRAGQKERREILAAEPFCRHCRARDKFVPAKVVDHIVPIAWGGMDARWNKQPLCHACHDAKSLEERTRGRPRGLRDLLAQLKAGASMKSCFPR